MHIGGKGIGIDHNLQHLKANQGLFLVPEDEITCKTHIYKAIYEDLQRYNIQLHMRSHIKDIYQYLAQDYTVYNKREHTFKHVRATIM